MGGGQVDRFGRKGSGLYHIKDIFYFRERFTDMVNKGGTGVGTYFLVILLSDFWCWGMEGLVLRI